MKIKSTRYAGDEATTSASGLGARKLLRQLASLLPRIRGRLVERTTVLWRSPELTGLPPGRLCAAPAASQAAPPPRPAPLRFALVGRLRRRGGPPPPPFPCPPVTAACGGGRGPGWGEGAGRRVLLPPPPVRRPVASLLRLRLRSFAGLLARSFRFARSPSAVDSARFARGGAAPPPRVGAPPPRPPQADWPA